MTGFDWYCIGVLSGVLLMRFVYVAASLDRRCEHEHQRCVHGDEINAVGGRRAQCLGCGRYLRDLPAVCSVSGGPH